MSVEQIVLLVLVLVVTLVLGYQLYKKVKNRTLTEEDIDTFKRWLVYACALAQKEIGKDTGVLKVYYVYSMAVDKFPIITKFFSFERFTELVTDAKNELLKLCESNENIKEFLYEMIEEAEQGNN